ncbi:MAG: ExeM/NucH family extracellular endonuclease [Pseudomonadota bacterium]
MNAFINEFHYDNEGGDVGEFVEIAFPTGFDLTGFTVALYNGSNGTVYDTLVAADGVLTDGPDGASFLVFALEPNGLQNGAPDAIALVDGDGVVVEFLSYEGSFAATDGPAAGLTSVDIGVEESGATPIGFSLQRAGTGTEAADFSFVAPQAETPGAANTGQVFDFGDTGGGSGEGVFTLELLHIADQEASTGAIIDAPNLSAVLNALRGEDLGGDGEADNTLTLSSGDAIIPGVFFDASAAAFGSAGIADIQIQNELGIEAIALGNHEFDLGTGVLAGLIDGSATGDFTSPFLDGTALEDADFGGTDFAYLSTNLDFSTDANLAPLDVAGGQDTSTLSNVVTSSSVSDVNGELVGIVGATTPTLARISSPGDVGIAPDPFGDNPSEEDLDALAAEIQAEVDALLADNPTMNKVILLSHMQQLSIEQALAERLTNVDIIVAGGSNTLLSDGDDRLRDGDVSQGDYPGFFTNAGGTTTAVVNTEGSYKYVGRLVIDFDADGNILADSYDASVSGAFATDAQGVSDLVAEVLVDPEIQGIVDAIEAEIIASEGNVFGVSNVFLNGNRSGDEEDPANTDGVRTQETNLGNLTADANLVAAQAADETVVVSIKNGGGIRANIGDDSFVPAGGTEAIRVPNEELVDGDGNVIKPAGGISQNDIATTLAFNNSLSLLTLTKQELVDVLEHGVSGLPDVAGRFPQVSGVKFSFDPDNEVGSRIQNAAIFDENDQVVAELVRDSALVGDANETFRIVTLNFLAGGGDGFPFPQGEEANRVDLDQIDGVDGDGNEIETFTGMATFAEDGTEQDALAEFLAANHADEASAFDAEDTTRAEDDRIQNLNFRNDGVFGDDEIVNESIVINEIDADNPGTDDAEFIELFDGGVGNTDLSGLTVVLYNGSDDASYDAIDLDGFSTDEDGFFVIGSALVENVDLEAFTTNGLQNGADAVALVVGDAADFPNDTPVADLDVDTLVDAIVYDTNDGDDAALLAALGQTEQFNEDENGDKDNESLSRVPDETGTFVAQAPTPGVSNEEDAPLFDIPQPLLVEEVVGRIELEAGAEIVKFDPETGRAFVTSGDGLQVVNASDITTPVFEELIAPEDLGFDASDITSVDVANGIVAIARPDPTGTIDEEPEDAFTGAGQVLFFSAETLQFLGVVQVGPLPDMLTFNEDGTRLLVANEGQSSGEENQPDALENPEGSISIIEVNAANPTISPVTTLDFGDASISFEALAAKGVRVNTDAPSAAADLEPEFITIDGNTAFIALQENNAVAVIEDITNPAPFTIDSILALGTKDHSVEGNGLDASDRDDAINIDTYDIQGLFQPDGMASYSVGGQTFFLTANEGDGRDVDESRGEDLVDGDLSNGEVDETIGDELRAQLADETLLGRLKFSNVDGDTDGDGDIDVLHSFGARSFSIFDAEGNLVFDSGDEFERITATLVPEVFNGNDDGTSFDNRSDDKGPEPEAVVLGEVDGTTYAFVGLERVGGVMVYDATDPANATFVQYIRNEDENGQLLDLAPEGLQFISAEDSPTGEALLAVASEESNTLTFHQIAPVPPTLISEIQGETDFSGFDGFAQAGVDDISPLSGQIVTIEAVVTAEFLDGLSGFFVQEEDADQDGNDATSEGLFIFDNGLDLEGLAVGDLVQVTGEVGEFFGQTQISADFVEIVSSGNTLPTATEVTFPTTGVILDDDGEFVADLEAVEGMLITIPTDMTVTEFFNLDRFGEYRVSSDGRLESFTQNNDPDVEGFAQHLQDIAARSVTLDDGSSEQNPDELKIIDGNDGILTADDSFRIGDTISDITGVLGYSFDQFRIQDGQGTFTETNPRPLSPDDIGGTFSVASLNVLNFFTTLDDGTAQTDGGFDPRGADDLTRFDTNSELANTDPNAEFDRQTEKLVNAIVELDADILGLVEIENTDDNRALQALVDAVNDRLHELGSEDRYHAVDPGGLVGGENGDAITTGLIFKANTVEQTAGTTVEVLDDTRVTEELGLDFGQPVFDGVNTNRNPVVATFTDLASGQELTVAVNHFKSKGGTGDGADADQLDGAGNFNQTRLNGSIALDAFLQTNPTNSNSDKILILGDLNAAQQEDPVTFLEDAGFTDLAEEFINDPDTPESENRSFVFDGQSSTLDYALANEALLADVAGVTEWHINADEADAIDFNLDFGRNPDLFDGDSPARNSDHDPVLVSFEFAPIVLGTDGNDRLVGTDAGEILNGLAGNDNYLGLGGDDTFVLGANDRDKVRDYEIDGDLLDVSAWGTQSIDELFIVGGHGRIAIVDLISRDRATINVDPDDPAFNETNFSADNFIFAAPEDLVLIGTDGRDRLKGRSNDDLLDGGLGRDRYFGNDGEDTFVIGTDDWDEIMDFQDGFDLIDISAWGVASVDDLVITEFANGRDINIRDEDGNRVVLRFAGQLIDPEDLTDEDFIFTDQLG